MKHLLIVYHSQSGSTERLAYAAASGARSEADVDVRLLRAFDASLGDLCWCDGLIVATPENLGYISGGMKDFLDRSYYGALPLQLNCAYALLISAGNDGSNAVRQLRKILNSLPMREVAEPLIAVGPVQAAHLATARDTGQALAAGLVMGIF